MIYSQTSISTELESKYIRHLCRHFSHKVEAVFNEIEGRVQFKQGFCLMMKQKNVLHLYCQSKNQELMKMLHYILDDHIKRFARTETLEYQWQEGMPEPLKLNMSLTEESLCSTKIGF